jgi:hypothetical protein
MHAQQHRQAHSSHMHAAACNKLTHASTGK